MEKTYCDLMLLASGVIAALAVSIIGIKIPSKQEFRKLRTARATLAASFITLSILNFICYFTGYDEDLDRLNTMIVAAFQALLLTGTLLVFIVRMWLQENGWDYKWRQSASSLPCSTA